MSHAEVDRAAIVDTDTDLTARAVAGDAGAFEELYRRHAQAAWRVARAVAGDPDDAADAVSDAFTRVLAAVQEGRYSVEAPFRPYLLTATRNAAIDVLRRRGRADAGDVIDLTERAGAGRSGHDRAGDAVVERVDRELVASAFRSLPDRWRAVLWLTEVEGVPPREAASMLGLSPNGVAQLAVRARAGLRARYLQAHLGTGGGDEECRRTVRHLGAYVAGGLAARDIAHVDQHLAGCAECRERVEELRDVGGAMALFAVPLPLALLAASRDRWQTWLAASSSQPVGGAAWLAPRGRLARTAGGWAAGVFAVGMLSLPDWTPGDSTDDDARAAGAPPAAEVTDPSPAEEVADVGVLGTSFLGDPGARPSRPRTTAASPDDGGKPAPPPPADASPVVEVAPAPPVAPADPGRVDDAVVEVAVGAAGDGDGLAVSVGVGGGCTGATIGSETAGCGVTPPEGTVIVVAIGGQTAPAIEQQLP